MKKLLLIQGLESDDCVQHALLMAKQVFKISHHGNLNAFKNALCDAQDLILLDSSMASDQEQQILDTIRRYREFVHVPIFRI